MLSCPHTSALETAAHAVVGFMAVMSLGACIVNGFTLGWTSESPSSFLWSAAMQTLAGVEGLEDPHPVVRFFMSMRTHESCRAVYTIVALHLLGVLSHRLLLSGRGSSLAGARRRLVRTFLLPTSLMAAYLLLADKDYGRKTAEAQQARDRALASPLSLSLPHFSSLSLSSLLSEKSLFPSAFQVAAALAGEHAVARELCFFALTWLFYYFFIHVLYYGGGFAMRQLYSADAPHLKVSWKEQVRQMLHSESAFPLYSMVPTVGDMLKHRGYSQIRPSVAACGGPLQSLFNFAVYMFLVEGGVFFVHYWMLHKWSWGKRRLNHDDHHKYVHDDEMTTFTGFAFEAIDGTLQGVPFVLMQFVVPVPEVMATAAGAFVGVWTMYIHVSQPALPWPFMGADYHLVHHQYNWFNFGLFTQLWDWMVRASAANAVFRFAEPMPFNTLRHPDTSTRKFALATKAKRKGLAELHEMWRNDK